MWAFKEQYLEQNLLYLFATIFIKEVVVLQWSLEPLQNQPKFPKTAQETITAISNALPLFASSNVYYFSWKETFLHTKRDVQHFFSQLRVPRGVLFLIKFSL